MDEQNLAQRIHWEWSDQQGALYKIRYAAFDVVAAKRLLDILRKIEFGDAELIDHDLVSVIWEIAYFVECHVEINKSRNPNLVEKIDEYAMEVRNELTRIFYFRDGFLETT